MADNLQLNTGADGAKLASKDVSHGGDTVQLQAVTIQGVSGIEGSYTHADIDGTAANGLEVDVTRVIPGTDATHLGKAISDAVGGTDTGVAILVKHQAAGARLATSDGEYDALRASEYGALLTEPEQHLIIDEMDALIGNGGTWAGIDADTTGVIASVKHVLGTMSIEFDKVSGVDSGIGGITKALTSIDLSGSSPHDILQCVTYVGDTAELDGGSAYFFLRLGTDDTAYNEWRIDGTEFTAGVWETVAMEIGDASFAGQGGNGIDWTAITYIAVGFKFDNGNSTLANIYVDEISFHTNQHVNAAINAEITSSVSSANINLQKIAGSPTTKGQGNASNGSQRIVLATDDINMAAINAAVVGSISGPGSPSIDSYTSDDVNVGAAANSQLIGTPGANKQLWVYGLALTANVAGSFSIQDEDDVPHTGIMPIATTGGFVMNPSGNFAMPWFKVATNKALEIDTVTCEADGVITYAIVSV